MCHTLIVLLGIAADWLCALAKFHGGAQYCQVAERFSNLLLTFTLALPPPSLSPSWNGPAEVVRAAQVANMGARSGQEWTSLFAEENSGTYNNQWMVLDVHALMAGERTGVLWVLEQLPGTVEVADLSDVLLGQGFWPSFNVPYFPRIYRLAGYPADKDIHG